MVAISVNQLEFGYRRATPVLANITFELPVGSIAGLMGANGTGKSTLIKLINGSLFPARGSLTVGQQAPSSRRLDLLQQIFTVPEEVQLPNTSPLAFVRSYRRFYPNFDQLLFERALERLEVTPQPRLLDYSLGQRKKFLIAFALATQTHLLLLDEPTNGLDIPSKEQFRQLLLETRTDNHSVIISTHQAHDLEGLIDRVLLMDKVSLFSSDINALTEHLAVGWFDEPPADALCSRRSVNQWQCLVPRNGDAETEVDLELLFTAFHQNKTHLQNYLV